MRALLDEQTSVRIAYQLPTNDFGRTNRQVNGVRVQCIFGRIIPIEFFFRLIYLFGPYIAVRTICRFVASRACILSKAAYRYIAQKSVNTYTYVLAQGSRLSCMSLNP